MPKTRTTLLRAIAGSVVVLMALGACSSNEPPKSAAENAPKDEYHGPAKIEKAPKVSADQLKAAVDKTPLGVDDVGHGVEEEDADDGLKTLTNDICGREWPTNGQRLARKQVNFWKDGKIVSPVVSNEVVAYKSGGGTKLLREVEKAIGDCDTWKHDQGRMDDIQMVEPPTGSLGNSFAWRGKDERKGTDYNYMAIYQAHGDLVSAVYIWTREKGELAEVADMVAPKVAGKLRDALKG